jgi:uncharacterized protein (DUF362 family)
MAQVALVKGDDRQGNIRRALDLIADQIDLKGRRPVIKVNFVSTFAPLCATHAQATRAVVEFLRDRGEKDIAIAEGAAWGTTPRGFREYGYLELAREYGLELIDLKRRRFLEGSPCGPPGHEASPGEAFTDHGESG